MTPLVLDEHVFGEAPDDRALGDPSAPHTLIMYASNMCPHCGSWFNSEWSRVQSDLVETGQLRFVFRPLPSEPAQLSAIGFMLAECAADETYMAVIEDQFERQSSILNKVRSQTGDLREDYAAIAAVGGLDTAEKVSACLANPANEVPMQRSSLRADAAEIATIPAFIFDGQIMKGDHDFDAIQGWMAGHSSARD